MEQYQMNIKHLLRSRLSLSMSPFTAFTACVACSSFTFSASRVWSICDRRSLSPARACLRDSMMADLSCSHTHNLQAEGSSDSASVWRSPNFRCAILILYGWFERCTSNETAHGRSLLRMPLSVLLSSTVSQCMRSTASVLQYLRRDKICMRLIRTQNWNALQTCHHRQHECSTDLH